MHRLLHGFRCCESDIERLCRHPDGSGTRAYAPQHQADIKRELLPLLAGMSGKGRDGVDWEITSGVRRSAVTDAGITSGS